MRPLQEAGVAAKETQAEGNEEVMSPHISFWMVVPPQGFTATCLDESARMRFSREAWLMHSGKVMEPRLWRNEEDYVRRGRPVKQEAA